MTAIKAEDILATLQSLELIQYRKGQHVICADPKVLDRHLKAAGRGGLEVDVSKLIWTPYKEQGWCQTIYPDTGCQLRLVTDLRLYKI